MTEQETSGFDVRRAMRLLSHTVRTRAMRLSDRESPAASVNHDFVMLRCRYY